MKFKILIASALAVFLGTADAVTKIACVGDSITWGFDPNDATSTGYETKLQTLLGSGYTVENDGVSSTTAMRKGSYPYWTKGKLGNVLAGKPDVVTIMLGTNDSRPDFWDATQYTKDYGSLIDTLNTLSSKPRIWIMFPPPTTRSATDRPSDANVQAEITILKQIAKARGLPTIDNHTPLVNFPKYFTDGIHPNQAGYDTIAHVMYRAMRTTALEETVPAGQSTMAGSDHFSAAVPSTLSFAGLNSRMAPGRAYSVKAFDQNGKMSGIAVVRTSEDLNAFGLGLRAKSPGLVLLRFDRLAD